MLSAWKDGLKEKKKGGGTETMLFGSITYGSPDTIFFFFLKRTYQFVYFMLIHINRALSYLL